MKVGLVNGKKDQRRQIWCNRLFRAENFWALDQYEESLATIGDLTIAELDDLSMFEIIVAFTECWYV
jgi:hypothetical protein